MEFMPLELATAAATELPPSSRRSATATSSTVGATAPAAAPAAELTFAEKVVTSFGVKALELATAVATALPPSSRRSAAETTSSVAATAPAAAPAVELTFAEKVARARAEHDEQLKAMAADRDRAIAIMEEERDRQLAELFPPDQSTGGAAVDDLAPAPTAARPKTSGEDSLALKAAWADFFNAEEMSDALRAHAALRAACGVSTRQFGRPSFDAVSKATLAADVPAKMKSLVHALVDKVKERPKLAPGAQGPRVVISGAGPVGLRAAIEGALLGQRVTVLEKRDVFSRVNILTLWQPTADDLMAYGAHTFVSKFSNRSVGNAPIHLGTREIQIVLLKNALLLGVRLLCGTELGGLHAPGPGASVGRGAGHDAGRGALRGAQGVGDSWCVLARPASSKATHQTAEGALGFKPNKGADYSTGVGMGKCNLLQTSSLDPSFAMPASVPRPADAEAIEIDALLLAEGEWSQSCKRLGISKSVDRFSQAIGLVINMMIDVDEPRTKDPNMRSRNITPLDTVGVALTQAGIKFEFGEYLKGVSGGTHYIALSIKKAVRP